MLRNILRRNHFPRGFPAAGLLQNPLRCVSNAPSETTTVMLRKLHPSATQKTLSETIDKAGLRIRKAIIEPGCAIQIRNIVHAECAATLVQKQFKCKAKVVDTTCPALILKNVPRDLSAQDIKEAFSKYDAKTVITSTLTFFCNVKTNLEAIAVGKLVGEISLSNQALMTEEFKTDDGYCVKIFNIAAGVSIESAGRAINEVLSTLHADLVAKPTLQLGQIMTLRIPTETSFDRTALDSALRKTFRSSDVVTITEKPLLMPTIFLRNIGRIGVGEVLNVVSRYEHDRIQLTYRSKDVPGDLAIMYFKTEASALDCLAKIKNLRINGKKLSSSYR